MTVSYRLSTKIYNVNTAHFHPGLGFPCRADSQTPIHHLEVIEKKSSGISNACAHSFDDRPYKKTFTNNKREAAFEKLPRLNIDGDICTPRREKITLLTVMK